MFLKPRANAPDPRGTRYEVDGRHTHSVRNKRFKTRPHNARTHVRQLRIRLRFAADYGSDRLHSALFVARLCHHPEHRLDQGGVFPKN